jgi:hypothetical protein
MNRKSLITSALISAGLISAASAQTTVYVTGSTAFRSTFFTAATTAGDIFDTGHAGTPNILSPAPNNTGSANAIVYHGFINGTEYILNCNFTGSEAGIAAVAGVTINNVNVPANYNGGGNAAFTPAVLPGAPVQFLTAPGYTTVSTPATPDLAMADTSQAVSLTQSQTLTDFGIVGIIPFVWGKCKSAAAPSSSWTDLKNVTNPQLLYELSGAKAASFFTGKAADADKVYVVGRNKGSGTRVNTMLTPYYFPKTPSQYQIKSTYNGSGVLTYNGATGSSGSIGGTFVNGDILATPGGDGFDSGKFVVQMLTAAPAAGATSVLIGYASVSDFLGTAQPNGAVQLTLDGVQESDGAVASGAYCFYGHEHLLGQATPSTAAQDVANGSGSDGIIAGIAAALPTPITEGNQSGGINAGALYADKPLGASGTPGDVGYPSQ